jgi:magnesium-transporting ATPase (P-type)
MLNPDLAPFKPIEVRQSSRAIFKLTKEELKLLFSKNNIAMPQNFGETRRSLMMIKSCNYMQGLAQQLDTHTTTGVVGDVEDMNRRTKIYGKNVLAIPKFPSFIDMLAEQFEDTMTFNLIVAATVYLGISLLND